MTVGLTQVLDINKNITIDGDLNDDNVADVTLDGQYRTQILNVTAGITAKADGLVITHGALAGNGGNGGDDALVSKGGAIYNAGDFTLNNVTVTANAASGGGGGGGVTPQYAGGAGGGGGAIAPGLGGRGGDTLNSTGNAGSSGQGGAGGGFFNIGGRGGSATGGAGGAAYPGYSTGSAGATANSGGLSIGGGGGGDGHNSIGGAGGGAVGGIYNDTGATLKVIGNSVISNNVAAGGGGGGGGAGGGYIQAGGAGGLGVGAIWNKGAVLITAANFSALAGNVGASGNGGTSAGTAGVKPTAVNNIYLDGGTLNDSYVPAPTATIVVADSALRIGETSAVTFTFSEAVTGFDNSDLTIANGTLSNVASSNGGLTWSAVLTPAAGVSDSTNLIVLNNTGVQNGQGAAGIGTTNSNNYAVDTVRPDAAIVVADTALRVGETSLVTFTFTEAVTGFTLADLTTANGVLTGLSSADGGTTWTATLTPSAAVTDATNIITLANTGVADASGNAGTGTTNSNNYAIDTVRPSAAIVVASSALGAGQTALVTFTFSEAVSGFTTADLAVANGSLAGLSSGDGGVTWTATLTPAAAVTDATNLITLDNTGVADAAGNAGTGTTNSNNYAIDTVRPTATIVVADTALRIGETSLVTFTFSEAVTGFTLADLSVANGSLAGLSTADNITYTATLTPTAAVTAGANLITLANSGVLDTAGNTGSGTTDSNSYAVDTVRPGAAIVVAAASLAAGQTSLVTVTFTEAVTGFTAADLSVANGAVSGLSSADGGITWTATLTPAAAISDTTNVITLANSGVADLAGNVGSGTTTSNNYAVDTQGPTASIVVADTALKIGETSLVTFTFSEAVSGFTTADLSVANGSLANLSSSDGGVTWTATLTPSAAVTDATNLITLDNTGVADAGGNAGSGTTDSNNYAIDTAPPTATIVVADTALTVGETSLVTITFAEAVSGFTAADLSVSNGSIAGLASADGGITWTATLTPSAGVNDATNLIVLNNAGVANAAGNAGSGTTDSNNYSVNTFVNSAPTGTVTIAGSAVQGQTLTAANTLADADGLGTIAYQWRADGIDIVGATGGAFTLSEAQVGKAITVVASYVDARGTSEAVGSSASSAVANLNDAPTGTVTFSGSAAEGQTLTAANTLADADGLGTIAYQWQAGGVAIGGAVNASYTLTTAEVGKVITVLANYVDGHGTAESVASTASTAVTPSAPPPTNTTVDGVPLQTAVVQNPVTGLPEQIVNAPIVTPSRPEDSATPNATLADIPLIASGGAGAGSIAAGVTVSLPTGSGFQSSGSATLLSSDPALLDLIARIDSRTLDGSPAEQAMMAQGTQFLKALPASTLLVTRTLVPTVAAGTVLSQPIVITGSAPATGPGGAAASAIGLVIDATNLPVSAVLQLDNVDFAAIIGAATLRGGAGQNFVIGDDAAQNIVLGPDDDTLFGGGGDDIIGSAGGNDTLDGGSGKDIVFGGTGNDALAGGSGNDMLQGGRSDQGRWDFYLNAQGQVVGMHNTALVNAATTEVLTRADLNLSVGKLGFAQAGQDALQSLSLLYHAAFGRTPDLAGLSYWAQGGRSAPELVRSFMQSNEWKDGLGKLGDVEFVNQLYKNALGRAGTADEITTSVARIAAAADHEQGRAQVFDSVALGTAHRAAWQSTAGVALGSEVLTQEQGWIKGGGDDRLDGGAGNDLLVGGDGNDTVVYAGVRANYAIGLTSDGQVTVTDRTSGDIDRIVQVEQGVFADGTVDLSFTSAAQPLLQQLGLMYQALFNRAGDLAGLNYWTSSDVSATAVAAQFLGSAEFRQQSGNLSDDAFVNLLFQNAVEHSPSADRLAYWDSYLDTHTRAEMVAALTENADLLTGQYGTEGLWLV